jgi:putative transposase
MTSKTVAALLSDLEVTSSHSRPKVSNDCPHSEAWFKTLKYAPTFPERFGCLADARGFMGDFIQWYNHEHRHTESGLHSPADVHYGLAAAKASQISHRPGGHPDHRQSNQPRTLHQLDPTQNPSSPRLGLDQPATTSRASRVTPTGTLTNTGPQR